MPVKIERTLATLLDSKGLLRLKEIGDMSELGYDLAQLVREDTANLKQLWNVTNDKGGTALMVSERRTHPQGREFVVYGLVGDAILDKELYQEIQNLARACGDKYLTFMTVKPGMVRLFEKKLKIKPYGWLFKTEINLG